jgi:hypothetical protein
LCFSDSSGRSLPGMTADASRLRAGLARWAYTVQSDAVQAVPDLVRPYAPVGKPSEDPMSSYVPGALAASITVSQPVTFGGTRFAGRVSAPVPQAEYTDRGTVPHEIVPVRAKVLRFPQNGTIVYRMHVNHPGNPPMPWWEQAVTAAYGQALLSVAVARGLSTV